MTPRQAFKFGFLYRCAEEGLGPDEAEQRAAAAFTKQAEPGWWGPAKDLVKLPITLGSSAVGAGALLSIGAGGLTGLALARMKEDDVDPEDIKRRELIDTYNNASNEAIQRRRLLGKPAPGMFGVAR